MIESEHSYTELAHQARSAMLSMDADVIHIEVSGELRPIRKDWWDQLAGPKPEPGFRNNGCSYVRDVIRGYAVWPACVIHDWHFSPECAEVLGSRAPTFDEANRIFRSNTYKILRLQGMNFVSAAFYAQVRYSAVQKLGRAHFRTGLGGALQR